MIVAVQVDISGEHEQYIISSARVRNVSVAQLARRILVTVVEDKMVLGILDDDDRPSAKTKPQGRKQRRAYGGRPPADKLFTGLTSSVPQRTRIPYCGKRAAPKTREELARELQQAVLNTGGELVK